MRVVMSRVLLSGVLLLLSAEVLPAQGGPAVVVVVPVVQREVTAVHAFVGTVEPLKRATIGSAVDGRVVEFDVEEGDRIRSGQALAKLLTATIELELKAAACSGRDPSSFLPLTSAPAAINSPAISTCPW